MTLRPNPTRPHVPPSLSDTMRSCRDSSRNPLKRALARRAYQSYGVKDVPNDIHQWDAATLQDAVGDLDANGIKAVRAALRKARKASPVVEKEVETLKGLIDAADVDVERAAELWAVIDAGVGEWIRTEIQKFRLAGIGADQESFI